MSYEAWGEPEDYPDPLDSVEFPRQRKPWKRDRDAIAFKMRCAIQDRQRANPMIVDSTGRAGHLSKDHALRFARLNDLHYQIFRFRRWLYTSCRPPRKSQRFRELAGLHDFAELIPYFDKAPLP